MVWPTLGSRKAKEQNRTEPIQKIPHERAPNIWAIMTLINTPKEGGVFVICRLVLDMTNLFTVV